MNKKTIGLCIGLCALTAFVTAVTVSNNTTSSTNTTTVAESSSTSETTSGITESETTIELPTIDTDTSDETPTDVTITADTYIGEEAAKEIALAHAELSEADVSFAYCKLDSDNGIYEYEVEFYSGTVEYDYDINATTGEIISYDHDMEHSNASNTQSIPTDTTTSDAYIGEEAAQEIAFSHAGVSEADATNLKCKLDYDDGSYEYEVEWKVGRTEYEYTILATDGTILEFDIDVD
ncbi:MAG: PepSY domain-containing protein [Eubacteriales bacterium]